MQQRMKLSVDVLKSFDFRLMLGARTLIIMALIAQDVVIGWQVYSLTKDPFMLGLIGLTEAVPAILCAFIAGHIVDISRPHQVYSWCIAAMSLNSCVLLLIGGGLAAAPFGDVVTFLFIGVFFSGVARSFVMPASFAILPQLVPRAQFPAASAWFSSGFQVAAIAGPAIAGLVYGGYGVTAAWTIPFSLMLIALALTFFMSKKTRRYRSNEKREPALQSIKAGWTFLLRSRTLFGVMVIDMFAVLFGGAMAMLPAYADQILGVGSEGLGLLRAAPALGAIITALYLALRPLRMISIRSLLLAVAGFGVCIIGFGVSTHFYLSVALLALSGAFDSVSMVIRSTIMQLMTPDAMRGRVASVNGMFIISSNEIGAFESGASARLLGLTPSIVFGGVCTLAVVAIVSIFMPTFRDTKIDATKERL